MDRKPLYVDLGGTLIKSDLLHESLLDLMKRNPIALCLIPLWLWSGRAHMKRAIAERVTIDAAGLPYSESFLAYLKQEWAAGRARVTLRIRADSLLPRLLRKAAAYAGLDTGVPDGGTPPTTIPRIGRSRSACAWNGRRSRRARRRWHRGS